MNVWVDLVEMGAFRCQKIANAKPLASALLALGWYSSCPIYLTNKRTSTGAATAFFNPYVCCDSQKRFGISINGKKRFIISIKNYSIIREIITITIATTNIKIYHLYLFFSATASKSIIMQKHPIQINCLLAGQ